MIGVLNSREKGTRRAVTPSGKEEGPAEGEKLDPFSDLCRFVRLRDMYMQIALLLRRLSVHLGEFDFLVVDVLMD
jgi:hypothetical protein